MFPTVRLSSNLSALLGYILLRSPVPYQTPLNRLDFSTDIVFPSIFVLWVTFASGGGLRFLVSCVFPCLGEPLCEGASWEGVRPSWEFCSLSPAPLTVQRRLCHSCLVLCFCALLLTRSFTTHSHGISKTLKKFASLLLGMACVCQS